MEFISKELSEYVEHHSSPESDLLHRINRETHLQVLKPRMLSGHLQGRFLAMITQMIQPKYILEIGTYTGYSAICMAEGLQKEGRLVTIDINEELEGRVKEYFSESGFGGQIDYKIGNALEIIPELDFTWDLVFIDADKANYQNYFDLTIDNTRKGGFIVADNVLWSGKILDETKHDEDTIALRKFNTTIQNDERVENVLFPIRDGLMVIRKK